MKRPVIALMASHDNDHSVCASEHYLNAIWASGGVGCVLPYNSDEQRIHEIVEYFDGFLFCGGSDIDPSYYNEEKHEKTDVSCPERDRFEHAIFTEIYKSGKPILGICRGAQIINVFLGGTLHQHIEGHVQSTPLGDTKQTVHLEKGTLLHRIIGDDTIYTNTFHHQNVKALADGLICNAVSEDGYIEAYHDANHSFCLGVQWHPEAYYSSSESSSRIFDVFINASRKTC